MVTKLERCIRKVKGRNKKSKKKVNAFAVCRASLKKKSDMGIPNIYGIKLR